MEFVLGLFLSPFMWVGLFLIALSFDHYDRHGWVTFVALVLIVSLFLGFRPPLVETLIAAAVYIPIGLVWSFWRFKRYVRSRVERFNADYKNVEPNEYDRKHLLKSLPPAENKARILYWVFWWPISFIESIIGDLIDRVHMLVTVVFRSTYEKIFNTEIDKLIK